MARTKSTERDVTILDWDGPNDPSNPFNWSQTRKWLVTGAALMSTMVVQLNGTSIAVAAQELNAQFHVVDTAQFSNSYWAVTSWSIGGAIFIITGLPVMEDTGVRTGFLITYFFFFLMIIPQAVARNYATLIVTRFFSGGASSLLANTISSVVPDIWATEVSRSVPVGLYILMYDWSSTLGPVIFAPVIQYIGDWRWIFYIQLIVYGALFPVFWLLLKETRGSVILRRKAKSIRSATGKPVYIKDELDAAPQVRTLLRSIARPAYLLVTEPILFAITLWSAFSFGTVFLFTQSTAQVFSGLYDWREYNTGYILGAVAIGELLGFSTTFMSIRFYVDSATRNKESPGQPIPEARLYVSVVAALIGTTGGMFVYAWTSYPSIPWIAPAIGLAMVGFGVQAVVTAACDYCADAYAASGYAGSAISAVAAGENIIAGFLPLAAASMYTNLGFHWASTLLAFLALLLTFAPVIFIWKGKELRRRSPLMSSGGQLAQGPLVS
ncbi:MFS general substrate transporter [Teratosphaeria nubilosa]|uniref:MFS general substrate transporter n=1 Tax=Teratosphaeria nubilosa TaxID=161662 RepID=A0A6G1LB26_9PEZI|nr:MFS general substrate transporter [Teratosphaeria nubilosa]